MKYRIRPEYSTGDCYYVIERRGWLPWWSFVGIRFDPKAAEAVVKHLQQPSKEIK